MRTWQQGLVWNGMEDDFSIFHTGNFLPFHFHPILKIFQSIFHSIPKFFSIFYSILPYQDKLDRKLGVICIVLFQCWAYLCKLAKVSTLEQCISCHIRSTIAVSYNKIHSAWEYQRLNQPAISWTVSVCTGFIDCKFIVTPTMKFGRAKLPKTFYKNTEKKFKCKKNTNKELSLIEDRKVNTNLCYDGRKSFAT